MKQIGGVLSDVDGSHYYGHYSLFALVHSHDREEIEAALPRIQNVLSDPSEAGLLEERRGAVSAYLSCFPGQPYNVRRFWLRGDHKANLSFVYSPFLGYAWSDDLRDEYTLVYETRQGTPFFWTPFRTWHREHNGSRRPSPRQEPEHQRTVHGRDEVRHQDLSFRSRLQLRDECSRTRRIGDAPGPGESTYQLLRGGA